MMTRTSSILFWFCLIIATSVALYRTSDRVQELNQHLRSLNASIDSEQQSIHVLKAEWAYLSSPARIEVTAKKFLAMRPTAPKQITSMDNLPEMFTVREKTVASATPSPIANIKTSMHMPQPKPTILSQRKDAAVVASAPPTRHVNERMTIERTASAQPLPDNSIGALINQLDAQQ
jgi:cell division protein FtsL